MMLLVKKSPTKQDHDKEFRMDRWLSFFAMVGTQFSFDPMCIISTASIFAR